MKQTALLFLAWTLGLLMTACSTARNPTAQETFDPFVARMDVNYNPETAPPADQSVVEKPLTNDAPKELSVERNIFALPPPLLQLPEQKAAREEVEKSSVSPALVHKMLQGQILTLDEIKELAVSRVSDTNIITYVRSTGAVYTLTVKQIDELRAASLSDDLLNYLLSAPGRSRMPIYLPNHLPMYRAFPPLYPGWWDHYHHDLHDFQHDNHYGGLHDSHHY